VSATCVMTWRAPSISLYLAAADQIFGAGGKRLRPALVFLVARATAALMNMEEITERQRRLAEITEMIHTASLVHDDVLVRPGSKCLLPPRQAV